MRQALLPFCLFGPRFASLSSKGVRSFYDVYIVDYENKLNPSVIGHSQFLIESRRFGKGTGFVIETTLGGSDVSQAFDLDVWHSLRPAHTTAPAFSRYQHIGRIARSNVDEAIELAHTLPTPSSYRPYALDSPEESQSYQCHEWITDLVELLRDNGILLKSRGAQDLLQACQRGEDSWMQTGMALLGDLLLRTSMLRMPAQGTELMAVTDGEESSGSIGSLLVSILIAILLATICYLVLSYTRSAHSKKAV